MTMEQTLAAWNVRTDDVAGIVRLARSLHRVGIKRRNSSVKFWQERGERACNDARDMLTFAHEIVRNRAKG